MLKLGSTCRLSIVHLSPDFAPPATASERGSQSESHDGDRYEYSILFRMLPV